MNANAEDAISPSDRHSFSHVDPEVLAADGAEGELAFYTVVTLLSLARTLLDDHPDPTDEEALALAHPELDHLEDDERIRQGLLALVVAGYVRGIDVEEVCSSAKSEAERLCAASADAGYMTSEERSA